MKHLLLGFTDNRTRLVEVTPSDHASVVNAMSHLLRVLGAEEKYDMLAENYDELEAELEAISRRGLLFQQEDWSHSTAQIFRVNRRLNNFMSTARLYLDHVDHDFCTIYGRQSEQRSEYQSARSTEYDTRLGYRVCEELRNYGQHRAIPTHGLCRDSSRQAQDGHVKIVHRVSATIDLGTIRSEGEFKREILEELEAYGSNAALKPLIREYMTGVGRVHATVRRLFALSEHEWKERISWAQARFREAMADDEAELYEATIRDDVDEVISSSPIFEDFLDRLAALRTKNAGIPDLTRQVRISE